MDAPRKGLVRCVDSALAQLAKRIVTTASLYGSGHQPARAQDRAGCWAGRLPELPWTWCHPK